MTQYIVTKRIRSGRRWIAQHVWNFAAWIYPYEENKPDTTVVKSHTITATFTGTQAEAEAVLDRVIGLTCTYPDHHPLALCNFMVGGMFSEPLEDDDE